MREIARISQCFFPTQDRIAAVPDLFRLTAQGPFIVLEAGCGTGQAIHDHRIIWITERFDRTVTILGIESDKNRFLPATA